MRAGPLAKTSVVAAVLFLGVSCTGTGDPRPAEAPSASATSDPPADAEGAPLTETEGVFHGVFVGRAGDGGVLVGVAATAPVAGQTRTVSVFACGARRLIEVFPPTEAGNVMEATSRDGDARVDVTLTADRASGTLQFADAPAIAFEASRASGADGLYVLDVGADGRFSGTTDAGIAASGGLALPPPGAGSFSLADGRSIDVEVRGPWQARGVGSGNGRAIVLPDGSTCGAAVQEDTSLVFRGPTGA